MEVASPLNVYDNKRSLARDDTGHVTKRRRFHETSVDSLANDFSKNSLWSSRVFSPPNATASNANSLKRLRDTSDLQATIDEQKAVIESLRNDKTVVETSFQELKTTHEKTLKENQILRKAVSIQQDKHTNLESQLRQQESDYQAKIKNLESVILSLKYHLSASNTSEFNSFRPPPGGDWCH